MRGLRGSSNAFKFLHWPQTLQKPSFDQPSGCTAYAMILSVGLSSRYGIKRRLRLHRELKSSVVNVAGARVAKENCVIAKILMTCKMRSKQRFLIFNKAFLVIGAHPFSCSQGSPRVRQPIGPTERQLCLLGLSCQHVVHCTGARAYKHALDRNLGMRLKWKFVKRYAAS
ncbi:hypothetical protein BG60_35755 [Caballeronia zhejiangensis]|uniref:Uncharacterized protein n=1 Tax=Caballeronia zhejiangensis TaxID=871203 RepID=A0A656QA76_9BURK|nr:hypothetical protein BG58_41750 [Caballeronia jiangsuensis]KDR24694.1 hypothetical protein BG60_35755 [Caballeronia zhejiangensis]KWU19254.1 hypothetical protein AS149_13550 [Burkholderia cenocepacia]